MKSHPFIISVFFTCMICGACINKNSISCHAKTNVMYNKEDTVIIVKKVPKELSGNNVCKVEYSVNINKANYSPSIIISKKQDKLIINLNSSLGDYSFENLNDTSAMVEDIGNNNIKYPVKSSEKYNLIRKMLERASKDFDFSKTETISFIMEIFEEDAIQITKRYKDLYGLEDTNFSNKKLADLIKESSLYKNLCAIFDKHSIKIKQVYVEDIILSMYSDAQVNDKSLYMLDAIVYFKTIH